MFYGTGMGTVCGLYAIMRDSRAVSVDQSYQLQCLYTDDTMD